MLTFQIDIMWTRFFATARDVIFTITEYMHCCYFHKWQSVLTPPPPPPPPLDSMFTHIFTMHNGTQCGLYDLSPVPSGLIQYSFIACDVLRWYYLAHNSQLYYTIPVHDMRHFSSFHRGSVAPHRSSIVEYLTRLYSHLETVLLELVLQCPCAELLFVNVQFSLGTCYCLQFIIFMMLVKICWHFLN